MNLQAGRLTPMRRRVLDAEFERLLELDENARAERLRELAQRCPRLTRWLGPLLDALSAKADHLDSMIREVADSAVAEIDRACDRLEPGTQLGAWRVIELVGRGGMGQVYRAERADGAFEMTAAVKVIRLRRDRRLRTRLTIERQLLARLDHPNIARILDGGTTDDGQAWLVMEWVSGQDLHQCRSEQYPHYRACLARFLRLAEAVAHAHQRQVVHGDIKPANVRIGEDGRVRLLDFGVARLAAAESEDIGERIRAITPAWSAPELRAGEPVSPASDQWSLGALLYWMLSGESFDPDLADHPRVLASRLRDCCPRSDDLAAVIATACARRPEHRYPSVADLIRDIERYRGCETVLAREPSRRYVTTRFIQRNPFAAGLSTLVVLLLMLGLAGTSWQARQAGIERDRAQLETRKTQQVSEFLVGLFEQADPWRAREQELTARDLADRGAERIRVLKETPQVQAEMFQVLARVHRGLADYERAGRLAMEAVDVLTSDATAPTRALADAWALHGDILGSQGRYQEAEQVHRRALSLVAEEPPPVRAGFMNSLGLTLYSLGRLDDSRALLEDALAIRRDDRPGTAELADSYNNLALLEATVDRNELAREYYDRAIELRREVLGQDHPTTSFSLSNLASLLVQTGRAEEALPAFREALAIRRNAFGPEHPAVGSVLYQLGWAHAQLERNAEARDFYEQALAIRERSLGDSHPSVAVIYNALGGLARRDGNLAESLDLLERALVIYRSSYGQSHHDIALVLGNLGATHMALNHHERALDLLERALEMNRRELGEGHRHVANNLKRLAELHLKSSRPGQAADYAQASLNSYRRIHASETHPAVASALQLVEEINAQR